METTGSSRSMDPGCIVRKTDRVLGGSGFFCLWNRGRENALDSRHIKIIKPISCQVDPKPSTCNPKPDTLRPHPPP